ncbi:uncharacterized protein LOC107305446 [Oryza brachyantha]|nr:uncharacterized protein LOC107305446 [Oryza brachyantha]
MDGAAAAAAAAGVPTVLVRGGDGVVFRVQARRLVELAPGFNWDLPTIASIDVYGAVQEYRVAVRDFTDPATGEVLDRDGLQHRVDGIFAEWVQGVEELGHLVRAATDLGMNDLLTECNKRVQELPLVEQQQVMQFSQNAPGHL